MRVDRRRFVSGIAITIGGAFFLEGCGDGAANGVSPVSVVPTSGATPSPAPSPSPTATPASGQAPVAVVPQTPAATLSTDAVVIAFAGASSAEQYLSHYDGPPTASFVVASSDGRSFSPLIQGAFGKAAGRAINAATGRSVRFIRGGVAGTTLAQWAAPDATLRTDLARRIVAAGGADAVLIQVGRNDATARIIAGVDAQAGLLRALVAGLRRETGLPNLQVFLGASQDALGGDDVQHRQLGFQRQAELAVAGDPRVRYGFSTYDLATIDGLHQTEAAQIVSGGRFAAQVIAWLQGAPERRGPRPVSARSLDPTSTEILIAHGGGSDIAPLSGLSGFQVAAGTRILGIRNAIRQSATVVRLTHESTGGATPSVTYALFTDTDDATCVRDNSAEALPLEPSPGILPLAD